MMYHTKGASRVSKEYCTYSMIQIKEKGRKEQDPLAYRHHFPSSPPRTNIPASNPKPRGISHASSLEIYSSGNPSYDGKTKTSFFFSGRAGVGPFLALSSPCFAHNNYSPIPIPGAFLSHLRPLAFIANPYLCSITSQRISPSKPALRDISRTLHLSR